MLKKPAKLIALQDQIRPVQYDLKGEACMIGRAVICQIILPFPTVSRLQAIIEQDETDGYVLRDNHSANGTYLNGCRLNAPHRLADHDEIGLGTKTPQLRFEAAK